MADVVKLDKDFDDLPKETKTQLLELAGKLESLDRAKDQATQAYNKARAELTSAQIAAGVKKFPGPDDDHQIIQNIPAPLDLVKFRKLLTDAQWVLCTERTFSAERLAAAVSAGKIRRSLVARCTKPEPQKPYLKSAARKK